MAGPGWRADVLVHDGAGRRLAVEVQLAAITLDEVQDRSRRHRTSGVETLWVVPGPRPSWARHVPSIVVDDRDFVVDSVLIAANRTEDPPQVAGPATVYRFAQRWSEDRLTPFHDSKGLWPSNIPVVPFQIDGCADAWLPIAGQQAAERAERDRERALRQAILATERNRHNSVMLESLVAFQDWFRDRTRLRCCFGGGHRTDPLAAVESRWDPAVGIVICMGLDRASWVVAMAEPHCVSPRRDPRVAAWTTGIDPLTDTTGFDLVITPDSDVDFATIDLKPVNRRRRFT